MSRRWAHLLLGDGAGGLRASAWNPTTTTHVHPETVVLENVNWSLAVERPWISAADNGTVVFVPGNSARRHPVWVDRRGRSSELPGEALRVTHTAVSRNGRRVSYGHGAALWVADIATGARTRILSDVNHVTGVWLPGDERMVVSSNVSGDWELYTVGTSGQSEMKLLLKKPFVQHPLDAAPDGTVVYLERHP